MQRNALQGERSISITQRTAGVLSGLLLLLAGGGVATAPPAAAVDDPTRPDARVTHGPSCRPGGLVVEVTAGTTPYFVRLATTRSPGGEDEATVAPGTTVVLRTDGVDWGERIDGRLEFTARDGSGVTFVDELDDYSFTRPTEEDCDAAHDPNQPHPPPASAGPAPAESSQPEETGAVLSDGAASGGATGDQVALKNATGDDGDAELLPLVSAAVALVTTAAGLAVAGRPRAAASRRRPAHSA